ncbi:YecA family protein [Kluyvera ascorbata]|nr:YecA family protein [Kluyvera ascorbata]HEB4875555.1 YecA family protein [Kluyvera ascorbata F0526]EJG2388615.1 YecA family protein [Kluyvera ascorbata]KFC98943.1 YgfB family exported protein [Kluyvera ascorbata ATCC 33433]MDT8699986.1 YecA family protein [Kluyvera ascorbata]MDU1197622.1 YecA family protein [Kluyvera ascorbata]
MSIQNEMPVYTVMNQLLNQQGVGLTPAEMHGLLSGLLCGGNKDSSWQPLVHDLTNEGLAFGHELAESLRSMHAATSDALEDDGFLFQLYLPEGDDVSVFDRADALSGWVNHFLLGLGMVQPKLDKVRDETGEAIDDLRNIAQLGYEEDEDQEELEMSLEEIIEYVRVAALLCHDTFTHPQPTAPEVQKPTLH